jgi:spore maturation protein CgeB
MNAEMLQVYFEAHKIQPIDAVVGYLSGQNTSPEILRIMANAGSIIFNFCWDDKLSFRGRKLGGRWTGVAAIASAVDLNLTNTSDSIVKYTGEGGIAVFWPEGADPDIHKPYDIPFEYDVSFVGQKYGWRPRFIKKLRKYGINVTTFGSGWENGPLSEEEMVRVYSKSRINLGFSGVGFSRKLMCLKGRDFEVPMSGGLYLTQDNPELSLVYEIGKEIVTYKDEKDCAEKIKWLLTDQENADKIRKAGRERALREHTWSKRFEKIFVLSGLMDTN